MSIHKEVCKKYFIETGDYTQITHRGSIESLRLQSGRQDSNLRPSAPKALNSHSSALGFQAISNFLLSSAKFDMTN